MVKSLAKPPPPPAGESLMVRRLKVMLSLCGLLLVIGFVDFDLLLKKGTDLGTTEKKKEPEVDSSSLKQVSRLAVAEPLSIGEIGKRDEQEQEQADSDDDYDEEPAITTKKSVEKDASLSNAKTSPATKRVPTTNTIANLVQKATAQGPSPITQSCLDLAKSTAAFSSDIVRYAESRSIKTWNSKDNKWQIPALDYDLLVQAFGQRTIYMMGDSTTAHLRSLIDKLMHKTAPEFLSTLKDQKLSQAIESLKVWQNQNSGQLAKDPPKTNSTIHWNGFRTRTMSQNCQFEDLIFPDIRKQRPHVLLANWGLHMLFRDDIRLCNLHQWVHYEQWLDNVFQLAQESGVKLLLFKTTNLLCPKTPATTERCWEVTRDIQVTAQDPPHLQEVSEADKERYCQEGLLTEDAAQRLNRRLVEYVAKAQAVAPSGMTLGVYNDHDMESCGYGDGTFYIPLGLPRIRLLAHTINCLYNKDGPELLGNNKPVSALPPPAIPAPATPVDQNIDSGASVVPTSNTGGLVANPVAQSCLDLTASTNAFAHDVFVEPESISIDSWSSNDLRWQIPALDHDLLKKAFSGRKITIVGDSTTAYLRTALNELLADTTPEFLSTLKDFRLTDARSALDNWYSQPERQRQDGVHKVYPNYENAEMRWYGFRGITFGDNCKFRDLVWPKIRENPPEILVVNWGLHMLFRQNILLCNLHQWLHYTEWLQEIFSVAKDAGVKLLLFKTTNQACGLPKNVAPAETCLEVVRGLNATVNDPPHMTKVSGEEKVKFCNEALQKPDSIDKLNRKLQRFVAMAQRVAPAGMKIAIYNDHDLESCKYSDGRFHFVPLGMPRVRLLAHMINCLYNEGGADPSDNKNNNKQMNALPSESAVSMENPGAVAQSCIDLTESTNAFAHDVFHDAEHTSIDIWTSKNTRWQIPALDHDLLMQAFGGRKISIVGDSTSAYIRTAMNELMDGTTPEYLARLKTYNLTHARKFSNWWFRQDGRQKRDRLQGMLPNFNRAILRWYGFRGGSMEKNCQFRELVWPEIRKHPPDILLANWGLHMLYRKHMLLCNVYHWIHYEEWLEEMFNVAKDAGVRLLLFKTTNQDCSNPDSVGTVDTCRKVVRALNVTVNDPPYLTNVSEEDKERFCNEGLQKPETVDKMNQILYAFVEKVKRVSPPGMTVAIYNDHDLESCKYSDGRFHYIPLGMPRARLLAHMVNCLLPREGNMQTTA